MYCNGHVMHTAWSISTTVIRWAWKTHGREDMLFFLTQLLWLHRHSLLCPLPLICMWTHCGQKMITDWLPCSTRNKLHACMYTTMCIHYQCINSGRSAEAPQAHLYTTRPSCITTYLPVAYFQMSNLSQGMLREELWSP